MKTGKIQNNAGAEWKPQFVSRAELPPETSARRIIDTYEAQLRELFAVDNPALFHGSDFETSWKNHLRKLTEKSPLAEQGRWVEYPWSGVTVHILSEKEFFRVRTARNRNLITEEEQKKFYGAAVGIAGLSIGMSVALSLALQGGAKRLKLADPDMIELSNLNRLPVGIESIGLPKVVAAARLVYEINPYADVELFSDGITSENVADFFGGTHPLSVAVDEMDNLSVKALFRETARASGVPVVMAADCDTSSVIDVERYDLDPKTAPFHGRLGAHTAASLAGLNKRETGALIGKHIGPENHSERMNESFAEVGRSLVSWPQLGGTALQNGVAVAHIVRHIVTGQPVTDARAVIALGTILGGNK